MADAIGRHGLAMATAAAMILCHVAFFDAAPGRAAEFSPPREVSTAIEALIDRGDPATKEEKVDLRALYRPRAYSPLWLDAAGQPGVDAREAAAVLAGAADDGLDPSAYEHQERLGSSQRLKERSPAQAREQARFDVELSAAMMRYLRHLHIGRVDPRTIGFRLDVPRDEHDFAALIQTALAAHRVAETAATLRPPIAQYGWLRTLLARYRALAADPAFESAVPAGATVRPGDPYPAAGLLYRQLVALGDLMPDTARSEPAARYQGPLVDGVKRFQLRHGLESDGVLGKSTQSAIRTPIAWRVRQIELALERLRWLPHLSGDRLVAINIPMFRLWAWNTMPPSDRPSLAIDVIVGRALRTQTPVFVEEMREVIFRPYWNVPVSILRGEILPIVARDPAYLRRQNMEIVRGPGDDARPVEFTPSHLTALRQGTLRLRQRPGPRNSLGLIKFAFPNPENVYMHGTPAQELFNRSRRDFSHGCVRVEDPVALAEWVLHDEPGWNRARIVAATEGTHTLHVPLTRPIGVVLFYTTAAVMPEDGTIRFADDIYRHDAKLDRALTQR
jgi:L,D-transpeptidase YcbB